MARVTVEDCLDKVDNRFLLVMLSAKRVKQLYKGARPTIENKSANKNATLPSTEATATTSRYNCSASPASDYNHDCQVNFADMAAMGNSWTGNETDCLAVQQLAADWLACTRDPLSECWQ